MLNVDDCVIANENKAECGGAMRDKNGNWITRFTRNIGTCSIEEAKAWAILTGLQLANDKGIKKIVIRSDSNSVVNMLKGQRNRGRNGSRMRNIINDCRDLINKIEEAKVMHVFREHNQVADAMAKMTMCYNRGKRVFDHPQIDSTDAD